MAALLLAGPFWLVVGLDLLAVTLEAEAWRWVTKPLLMPLLVLYAAVVGGRRDPVLRTVFAALAAAWLADIALLMAGTTWFLTGVALFGVTQLCYLWVFWRLGALERLRRHRWVMAVMGLVWLLAVAGLGSPLGDLALPVAAYGLLLVAMATLATGVNRFVAAGGMLFVLSDLMVGAGAASVDFALRSQAVMATYTLGQFLIVLGCLRCLRAREAPDRA